MRSILFLLSPLLLAWTATGQQGPNGPPRMGQGPQNEPIQAGEITYQNGRITCKLGSVIGNEIFHSGSCHLFLYVNNKLKANVRSETISYEYKKPIRAEVMCRAQCSNIYYERNNIQTETLIVQEGPFIGLLVGLAIGFLLILAVIVIIALRGRRRRKKEYRQLESGQAPPLPVKQQQPAVVTLPTEEERAAEKERQIEQDQGAGEGQDEGEMEEDSAPPLPEKTRPPASHSFSMKELESAVGDRNKDESDGSSSDWDNTNAASYYPATATTHRYAEVTSEI